MIFLMNLNKEDFNLSFIKDRLLLKDSTFDQRSYGFDSMYNFIEKTFPNEFEINKNNQTTNIKKNTNTNTNYFF